MGDPQKLRRTVAVTESIRHRQMIGAAANKNGRGSCTTMGKEKSFGKRSSDWKILQKQLILTYPSKMQAHGAFSLSGLLSDLAGSRSQVNFSLKFSHKRTKSSRMSYLGAFIG